MRGDRHMLTMGVPEVTPTTLNTGQQFKVSIEVTSRMTWGDMAKCKWETLKQYTWAQIKGVVK